MAGVYLDRHARVHRTLLAHRNLGIWRPSGYTWRSRSRLTDEMSNYQFTPYFEQEVLRKRPYLTKDMCIRVVEAPLRMDRQEKNRFRFWAAVAELDGRYLRVITLDDQLTIHNAFPDRGFKP